MSVAWRRFQIEPTHQHLSITAQCRLLSISRSSYYYAPVPETDETLELMATPCSWTARGMAAARWRGIYSGWAVRWVVVGSGG